MYIILFLYCSHLQVRISVVYLISKEHIVILILAFGPTWNTQSAVTEMLLLHCDVDTEHQEVLLWKSPSFLVWIWAFSLADILKPQKLYNTLKGANMASVNKFSCQPDLLGREN